MKREKATGAEGVKRVLLIGAACGAFILMIACGGNEPVLVINQTANASSNTQSGNRTQAPSPAQPQQSAPARSSSGDYIDTSENDAKIKGLEEQAKKRPNDATLRKQLAVAYLERGNALTQARQYQAALGDYRRTLKLDPNNEEARRWSQTIIGIMQQMNREVPAEGAEPTPLKKES